MQLSARREALGARLRSARLENHLSQHEAASEFKVSNKTISAWELGENVPDVFQLADVAARYGCSVDYLILGIGHFEVPTEAREHLDAMPMDVRDRFLMLWALFGRRGVGGPAGE